MRLLHRKHVSLQIHSHTWQTSQLSCFLWMFFARFFSSWVRVSTSDSTATANVSLSTLFASLRSFSFSLCLCSEPWQLPLLWDVYISRQDELCNSEQDQVGESKPLVVPATERGSLQERWECDSELRTLCRMSCIVCFRAAILVF